MTKNEPKPVDYAGDKLYQALVAAIKVAASEHGPNSREYWSIQAVITNLRPEQAKADPKSPLQSVELLDDGPEGRTTQGYADRTPPRPKRA